MKFRRENLRVKTACENCREAAMKTVENTKKYVNYGKCTIQENIYFIECQQTFFATVVACVQPQIFDHVKPFTVMIHENDMKKNSDSKWKQ